ncbi:CTP synthase [Erwinia sp. JUb26]|uniref:CTP synthase C-terminal region-related (seleno)protein n=1 Tax=Erwinia sp. JUb26 TaxID=2485126 RepID=UPI000F480930|nr:CTP synthase [Erwinia sp. JUb26]ROR13119.1 glutamine amidotransferase class I [Erwinia sp. JUb26]
MTSHVRLALMGDYRADAVAHQAIPLAVDLAAQSLNLDVTAEWLPTPDLTDPSVLARYDAVWLVPGSPYLNDEGAFMAIRHARENNLPFLGSCGGFQYAVVEYARNVLGWKDAGHAETDSGGRLVIAPLSCSLVEKTGTIVIQPDTRLAGLYGKGEIEEGYHCNYGVNADFVSELQSHSLRISAHDLDGDVRAIELPEHRFFMATLFQSERAALRNELSPMVVELLRVASQRT